MTCTGHGYVVPSILDWSGGGRQYSALAGEPLSQDTKGLSHA